MKANDQILEKIAKILRLANDAGATDGEIEAAMAQAKKLAIKHNIELASINISDKDSKKVVVDVQRAQMKTSTKGEQLYHRHIFMVLEYVCGIRVVYSHYRKSGGGGYVINRITLVGDETDVAMAQMVFPWLEKMFPKTYSRLVREGRLGKTSGEKNGCYYGLADGIIYANRQVEKELEEQEASAYALVVVSKKDAIEKFVDENFKFKKSNFRREFNHNASALGFDAGRKINLNQIN